jgi:hypothetical protein
MVDCEQIDISNLREALLATAEHRETDMFKLYQNSFTEIIKNDFGLKRQWSDYQREFEYAANVDWSLVVDTIGTVMKKI